MEFNELSVSEGMIHELARHGITKPTNVQEKVIPLVFNKKDVIVQSETGSGKTISFAAPSIDTINRLGTAQVLVIAPTRELALQISEEYFKLSRFKNLGIATVYGGASFGPQIRASKDADIVIGTPGRLLDLIDRRVLKLGNVKHLILDEADRLLDMGFINEINELIKHVPSDRQSLMFSATVSKRIMALSNKYMKSPEKVILNNVLSKNVMKQYYYDVEGSSDKKSLLVHLIKKEGEGLKLVFCNTKRKTKEVTGFLKDNGVKAGFLNGDMTQAARERRVKEFGSGYVKVLVATDVAARGLDIQGITKVFNYDLPHESETYSHRIGRTARNGNTGVAITLLSKEDYGMMDTLTKECKLLIDKGVPGNYERIAEKKFENKPYGRGNRFRHENRRFRRH